MDKTVKSITPVSLDERYISLDLLRGIAVLGILIMNIQSFSMIYAAYMNPMAYGDMSGINKWVWILSHIFADQKFITLFSILFGAGVFLFSNRLSEKGINAAKLHYRRIFWLFIIGLIHAYVFWHGDILVSYSICALIAFLFRNIKPRSLVIIALFLIIIPSLIYFFFGLTIPYWPPEAVAENTQTWVPEIEKIGRELDLMRGSIGEQLSFRAPASFFFQTFVFLIWTGWKVLGLMLLGMAFFKTGVLTGERSTGWYTWFSLISLLIGLTLIIFGLNYNFSHQWKMEFSMFLGWQFNYWGSLFMALFYLGLIMLLAKTNPGAIWLRPFTATGRMAFTNYLLMTLICTSLFYGHGFGLFGSVSRVEQLIIVFLIWLFLMIFSMIWLNKFRFGPLEWTWRSLTYWQIQPIK